MSLTRDNAHFSRLEYTLIEGWHEADKALTSGDEAGSVRTDDLTSALPRCREKIHRVVDRHVLGETHDLWNPSLDGVQRSGLDAEGRDEHHGAVDFRFLSRILRTCPNRQAQMRFTSALRIGAADNPRAIGPHLIGPERALLARDAHHEHGFVAAHDHCDAPFAAATAARTASSIKS